MRIFATWTFQWFYIVLYWTDIQFPRIFFWSGWLPMKIKCIHKRLSPWSGVFQVNNNHPYKSPPTIQVFVRLFLGVFNVIPQQISMSYSILYFYKKYYQCHFYPLFEQSLYMTMTIFRSKWMKSWCHQTWFPDLINLSMYLFRVWATSFVSSGPQILKGK